VALGAVFISGVLFLILSVTRIRSWIVDAIPMSQKMAISAGIGLFLAIIALKEAGIVVASPDTLVTLGDVKSPALLLASAGFLVSEGRLRRIGRVFVADSLAAMGGALLGTSTVTSYIESAAGVKAGGRTGLTAITVAILFLLTLFLAPLAQSIPAYATAPAL